MRAAWNVLLLILGVLLCALAWIGGVTGVVVGLVYMIMMVIWLHAPTTLVVGVTVMLEILLLLPCRGCWVLGRYLLRDDARQAPSA